MPSFRSGYILFVTPPPPPPSSISYNPAKSLAQPNPNKALASVKQGALHKRWCQLATQTDGTLYSEHLSACVGAHMPACVNVVYVCHSDPVSINRQFLVGFDEGFEVISWEPLTKATALPREEWHHGIEREVTAFSKRFWMIETVNDCLQVVWSHNSPFYST